ncbi:MAG: maleylpyruvate isomerase family mycothiol-dependent enzyme [Propionibacteriales bacterium]|nr:maleylpyruvate isomerase family mycothiol-dependent enzyme [Propionibacteriales bacterium]
MNQYPGPVPLEDVHRWKTELTQRLLGYTIAFTEDEWHQPARLPGWSRAHLATHLARNADELAAILTEVAAGRPQPEPTDAATQRSQLEAGADRNGLALQIDMDAAAGALQHAIEQVSDWDVAITLHGERLPLSALPLDRLHEVSLHLLDLDCGAGVEAIPPGAAEWLLRWALFRLKDAGLPAITLNTESVQDTIGTGTDLPLSISGSDADIWGWLTGRLGPASVDGADGLILPLLS